MLVLRPALFLLAILTTAMTAAHADEAATRAAIAKFGHTKSFSDVEKVVKEVASTGDPSAARALDARALAPIGTSSVVVVVAPDTAFFVVDNTLDGSTLDAAHIDAVVLSCPRAACCACCALTARASTANTSSATHATSHTSCAVERGRTSAPKIPSQL